MYNKASAVIFLYVLETKEKITVQFLERRFCVTYGKSIARVPCTINPMRNMQRKFCYCFWSVPITASGKQKLYRFE